MTRPKTTSHWDRPEEYDHLVLVADDDDLHRNAIVEQLSRSTGRLRSDVLGAYPRFRVVAATNGEEALRKAKSDVTVAAIDLVMPRRNGIEVIQELRARRLDLAILAFTAGAPPSEAVAAVMAGADHFYEFRDVEGFENALDMAIDRRRLTRLIEQNQAEAEEARQRLAKLAGNLGPPLPGLRPPQSREVVLPFKEAVKRYLAASARFFEGDPAGLAKQLGLSYFSVRRLFVRYNVPFPSRPRKSRTRKG
jgi:CheY-like chemotaxis protein